MKYALLVVTLLLILLASVRINEQAEDIERLMRSSTNITFQMDRIISEQDRLRARQQELEEILKRQAILLSRQSVYSGMPADIPASPQAPPTR